MQAVCESRPPEELPQVVNLPLQEVLIGNCCIDMQKNFNAQLLLQPPLPLLGLLQSRSVCGGWAHKRWSFVGIVCEHTCDGFFVNLFASQD